jgi:hypothetical protein
VTGDLLGGGGEAQTEDIVTGPESSYPGGGLDTVAMAPIESGNDSGETNPSLVTGDELGGCVQTVAIVTGPDCADPGDGLDTVAMAPTGAENDSGETNPSLVTGDPLGDCGEARTVAIVTGPVGEATDEALGADGFDLAIFKSSNSSTV